MGLLSPLSPIDSGDYSDWCDPDHRAPPTPSRHRPKITLEPKGGVGEPNLATLPQRSEWFDFPSTPDGATFTVSPQRDHELGEQRSHQQSREQVADRKLLEPEKSECDPDQHEATRRCQSGEVRVGQDVAEHRS